MSERMTLSHATHATQCDGAPHRRPVPGGLPGIRSWPEVDLGPTDSTRDLLSNFIALVTRQQAPLFGCTLGHSPRLSQVSGRPLAKMGCRLGLSFLAQRDRLGMFIGGSRRQLSSSTAASGEAEVFSLPAYAVKKQLDRHRPPSAANALAGQ